MFRVFVPYEREEYFFLPFFFFFLEAKLVCYNREALFCSKKQLKLPAGTGVPADSSVAFIIVIDKWP